MKKEILVALWHWHLHLIFGMRFWTSCNSLECLTRNFNKLNDHSSYTLDLVREDNNETRVTP